MTLHKVAALTLACLLFVGGFSSPAGAQSVASSFSEIENSVKRGKTIYVTDDAGQKIKGKLADLSGTSLTLLVSGEKQTVAESRVREIRVRERKTRQGATIGLLIGIGLGLFGAVNTEECVGCPSGDELVVGGMVGLAGLGAGIGAVFGAEQSRERLVYRAGPRPPVAFSLAPLASSHGTGVRAVLKF